MTLSSDLVLVYVLLRSGVRGLLTSGRIERRESGELEVYDKFGELNEYISGARLRSWRFFSEGFPVPEWSRVSPEDAQLLATLP